MKLVSIALSSAIVAIANAACTSEKTIDLASGAKQLKLMGFTAKSVERFTGMVRFCRRLLLVMIPTFGTHLLLNFHRETRLFSRATMSSLKLRLAPTLSPLVLDLHVEVAALVVAVVLSLLLRHLE